MKKSDMHLLAAAIFVAPHLIAWTAWPIAVVMVLCACIATAQE